MGAILPNTPEIRAATSSCKLCDTLDLIEGDFLNWKKLEQELLGKAAPQHKSIIDISSATSMRVFADSATQMSWVDSEEIMGKVDSYPYVIPKEHKLEELFCSFFKNESGEEVSKNEVVTFNGVFAALRTIVRALPGQYVLFPEFANHAQKMSVTAMGKTVVEVPMFAPGWTLDLDALRQKLEEIGNEVACMYIYHSMPADISGAYLEELGEILAEYDVVPVIDLDVLRTQHTDKYSPLLPFFVEKLRERGIYLINMSKEFAAPGIRIGFGIANSALASRIKKFQQISLEMIPPTNRLLAERILQGYHLPTAAGLFISRMKHLVRGLQGLDMEANQPHIGVNLFMHVPRSFEKSAQVLPDHLFTYYCLTRAGVILRPASIYGHRLNHFVRFVVCQPTEVIDEMFGRFKEAGIHGKMDFPEYLEKEYQESIGKL